MDYDTFIHTHTVTDSILIGNTVLIILRMVCHTCYTIGVLILFSNEGKHLQKQFHKTVLIHQ
jgi:hypothetical protein